MLKMIIPNDADGDALRRLIKIGADLTKPMDIDFHVAAPDEGSCQAIGKAAAMVGFRIHRSKDHNRAAWTCSCTKSMIDSMNDTLAATFKAKGLCRSLPKAIAQLIYNIFAPVNFYSGIAQPLLDQSDILG